MTLPVLHAAPQRIALQHTLRQDVRRALVRCGLTSDRLEDARLALAPLPGTLDVTLFVPRDAPVLRVRVTPRYTQATPLHLFGLARAFRGALLHSVLAELAQLCRATRPLLTPIQAWDVHELAFGDEWTVRDLLYGAGHNPDTMTAAQQRRAVHALGHVSPQDARSLYGPRPAGPEALRDLAPFMRGRRQRYARALLALSAEVALHLAPLHLQADTITFRRYAALRPGPQDVGLHQLAEALYDRQREDGSPDLYVRDHPLTAQGLRHARRALGALRHADTLALRALHLTTEEFPC